MNKIFIGLTVSIAFAAIVHADSLPARPTGSPTGSWSRTQGMDTSKGTQLERGAAVFHNRCSACHGTPGWVRPDGNSDMPGTSAIFFKYKGAKPGKLEEWTDLSPEVVKYFVRNGTMYMPQFRKTDVSDEELDALAAYLSRPR
ncbi:MAG: c-type cytochrome [Steroidobacteraceae bacterium]